MAEVKPVEPKVVDYCPRMLTLLVLFLSPPLPLTPLQRTRRTLFIYIIKALIFNSWEVARKWAYISFYCSVWDQSNFPAILFWSLMTQPCSPNLSFCPTSSEPITTHSLLQTNNLSFPHHNKLLSFPYFPLNKQQINKQQLSTHTPQPYLTSRLHLPSWILWILQLLAQVFHQSQGKAPWVIRKVQNSKGS